LSIIGAKKGSNPVLLAIGGLFLSFITIATAYLLLKMNIQWLPFSAIALGLMAQIALGTESFLQEKRRRQQAVQLFNRFLDPRVVQQLTNQTTLADAEVGRSQEITVLFSDIRGFTTLSETRSPEEIVTLLNQYFDQQVEVIFEHHGTLDKFIGDAIMAFWGAPIATADHAQQAVLAALAMSENLEKFRLSLGYPFEIGIGIHTGKAVVGLIGSSRRLDYTAIGDAVNLASRIEGETKGVSRILVSESTRNACGDMFDFIDHNEFTVKGRAQSVRLFEPRRK
jgi:adenylate cyclase